VVGWTYDAAGNVVSNGVATATYDALSRPVTITAGSLQREAAYNGDGVLVAYTEDGVTSQLAQDLAAPLSQVLHATQGVTTATYRYGPTRLATVSGPVRSWELGDALGSVRMTLDDAGTALGSVGYDPWGAPQGELLGAFGFTGELQEENLTYLRARWYDTDDARFMARDPFAGFPATPYSLHPYQYGYSNPALWTDPSGWSILPNCSFMSLKPRQCQEDAINDMIDLASKLYSKTNLGCHLMHDDGIADDDDVGDLLIDYICEFGPRDRVFGQNARLTKQLAQTKLIANMRAQFYLEGGVSSTSKKSSQMGPIDFLTAKFIDMARTGTLITITDFLGGVDEWSVTRARSAAGKDVARFEIYNETTLPSGTRIGFTKDGTAELSLEEYRSNPAR
jgi:RHS repeat-associated protein